MRKRIVCAAVIFAAFFSLCGSARAAELQGGAQALVLIERDSLRVLYEYNKDEKLPMASTTKVMTALLAIENGDLDDVVTVSQNASGTEGSSIWLGVGEHITLRELLYGLMLSSGNDAAIAVAEHISGSVEEFVALMNKKAAELGAQNTHFVNPNGLHNENHYTSAYDLAIITAYAMKNDTFREIVATEKQTVSWEGHEYDRVLKNKNRNLWQYDGATGVKTGFTRNAGRCLVASAEKNGMELICVMLNDYDMFAHSREVLDYGFTNYQKVNIVNKGELIAEVGVAGGVTEKARLVAGESVSFPLNNEERKTIEKAVEAQTVITAPKSAGDAAGEMSVSVCGTSVANVPLLIETDIIENSYEYNLERVMDRFLYG